MDWQRNKTAEILLSLKLPRGNFTRHVTERWQTDRWIDEWESMLTGAANRQMTAAKTTTFSYKTISPAVDLVSDPPTELSTPSRGAEPSSESVASLTLDLLHGTVFHTISIISVTLVFSSTTLKLNDFVEHTSLVLVSTPGRSVNSAIEMTVLLLLS